MPLSSVMPALPVRFRILALLFLLSLVNYLLRNNISIVAPTMREEIGFTTVELGWIIVSFNITYALFQIPSGMFGDWLGPRRALALAAFGWGLLTALTGFTPQLLGASAGGAMIALMAVRLAMGMAQAPMYPVAAISIASWFPAGSWAFPNAMLSAGLALGQAMLGPIVTFLIISLGWRESFYVLAPAGVAIGFWWWRYARDRPEQHPAIGASELALISAGNAPAPTSNTPGAWRVVLVKRDVLLVAAAYFCMNYVFYMFAQWLFTYLVEERGFSLLESGLLYALPFVVGAALATVGGVFCDVCCRQFGLTRGCRMVAVSGLLMVAFLLPAGAYTANPYVAVALLALCFGFTQLTEGAFWAGATYAAGAHPGTGTGVMNTGGNLPGFLAPAIGLMIDRLGWLPTLASGSLFALLGAALWFFIKLDEAPPAARERLGREW